MRTGGEDDSFMKFWAWDKENLPSITHSIRTAVAATVSVIIARLVHTPEAYWDAIATLVVMQSTLGATLTLSIERIMATAVGASVGALEANFFGANLVAFALAIYHRSNSALGCAVDDRFAQIPSKSQSASSLLSRWWRCGQNIDDFQSVARPNSASLAITFGLAKEINFRQIDNFIVASTLIQSAPESILLVPRARFETEQQNSQSGDD